MKIYPVQYSSMRVEGHEETQEFIAKSIDPKIKSTMSHIAIFDHPHPWSPVHKNGIKKNISLIMFSLKGIILRMHASLVLAETMTDGSWFYFLLSY